MRPGLIVARRVTASAAPRDFGRPRRLPGGCALLSAVVLLAVSGTLSPPLGAAPVAVSKAPACVPQTLADLRMGFTLTHESARAAAETECRAPHGSGASVSAANNIVGRYDRPEIRRNVQRMLSAMAAQGANSMRTILWYRHAEDAMMAKRKHDPLGLAVATKGRLPDQTIRNLTDYIGDAKAAGYRRFIVVVGTQGTSNPKCRREDWGDCYDDSLIASSWSVAEQVGTAVRNPTLAGIDVILDIAPTSCAAARGEQLVARNLRRFSRYMVEQYHHVFADNRFITSCGAGNADRDIPELKARVDLFKELGVRPAALDVHVYDTDEPDVRRLLLSSDDMAKGLGVPVLIGETYYDHPNVLQVASELVAAGRIRPLTDLLVFPRRAKSACQIGVPAPYDMAAIGTRLGKRDAAGAVRAACR